MMCQSQFLLRYARWVVDQPEGTETQIKICQNRPCQVAAAGAKAQRNDKWCCRNRTVVAGSFPQNRCQHKHYAYFDGLRRDLSIPQMNPPELQWVRSKADMARVGTHRAIPNTTSRSA